MNDARQPITTLRCRYCTGALYKDIDDNLACRHCGRIIYYSDHVRVATPDVDQWELRAARGRKAPHSIGGQFGRRASSE